MVAARQRHRYRYLHRFPLPSTATASSASTTVYRWPPPPPPQPLRDHYRSLPLLLMLRLQLPLPLPLPLPPTNVRNPPAPSSGAAQPREGFGNRGHETSLYHPPGAAAIAVANMTVGVAAAAIPVLFLRGEGSRARWGGGREGRQAGRAGGQAGRVSLAYVVVVNPLRSRCAGVRLGVRWWGLRFGGWTAGEM